MLGVGSLLYVAGLLLAALQEGWKKGIGSSKTAHDPAMAALATDLKHMNQFLVNQKDLLSETAFNEFLASQAKVFVTRFQSASLTTAESSTLSSVLMEGPWTKGQKEELGRALATGLVGDQPAKGQRRPSQDMSSWPCYMTDKDFDVLESSVHNLVKINALISRCILLGLHLPSTSAVKHIISSAVDCNLDGLGCFDGVSLTGFLTVYIFPA